MCIRDSASTAWTVERRDATRRWIASAEDGDFRPAEDAKQPREPSVSGAHQAARSQAPGPEGSTTAMGRVASKPSTIALPGERPGTFDSRVAPLSATSDEPAIAASLGSAIVEPLNRAIESAGDRPVTAANPLDRARPPSPDPVKTPLSDARRVVTARLAQPPDRISEPLGEAPTLETVLSITETAGVDTSTGLSFELETEPRLGLIQSAPAVSVRAPVPGHSLDPRGDRPIRQPAEAEPTIEVHIGRIEVKPLTPPPPAAPPARPRIPAMTLDEYRRKRQERRP